MIYKIITYPTVKRNMYKISENGDIINIHTNKMLSQFKPENGYPRLTLQSSTGGDKTFLVHRLVAYEFVHNPDTNKFNIVNHLDGNKQNNNYNNLEWTDSSGNMKHAFNAGLLNIKNTLQKYDESTIRDICKKYENGMSVIEVLEDYGYKYGRNVSKETKIFYSFLIAIRLRSRYNNITCDYEYDSTTTGWKKWYHKERDNILNHYIHGLSPIQIYNLYGYKKIKEYEKFYNYIKDLCRNSKVQRLSKGQYTENPYLICIRYKDLVE